MPASARRSGICSTSPAALGVVKVGPDFHYEFPDGDPAATEAFATILRYGRTARADLERTMLASFGAPQNVLNSLAVIEGAQSVDLVRLRPGGHLAEDPDDGRAATRDGLAQPPAVRCRGSTAPLRCAVSQQAASPLPRVRRVRTPRRACPRPARCVVRGSRPGGVGASAPVRGSPCRLHPVSPRRRRARRRAPTTGAGTRPFRTATSGGGGARPSVCVASAPPVGCHPSAAIGDGELAPPCRPCRRYSEPGRCDDAGRVMDAADTIDDSVVCAWATKPPAQTPRALTEPPAFHAQHQSADDGDQPTLF